MMPTLRERWEACKGAARTTESATLEFIGMHEWPGRIPEGLFETWLSKEFLVQVYRTPDPDVTRLTVCRTELDDTDANRWKGEISWDELQRLKSECGRGQFDAVEFYPRDADVVNVANMRHLWVYKKKLPLVWRRRD